jgi:hypothetical protein
MMFSIIIIIMTQSTVTVVCRELDMPENFGVEFRQQAGALLGLVWRHLNKSNIEQIALLPKFPVGQVICTRL